MSKDKKVHAPNIPFWKSPFDNDTNSVVVSPQLYDTVMSNLKIGQVLYLNIFQFEENKPIAKIKFGPMLAELQATRKLAQKHGAVETPSGFEAAEPAEEEAPTEAAGGDFFG